MNTFSQVCGLTLVTTLLLTATTSAEFTLARDGKARHAIVIAPNCSQQISDVADDLAQTLQLMTGAEFDVFTGDGATGIVVGNLEQFPNPDLSEPLAIRNNFDGREAFAISKCTRILGKKRYYFRYFIDQN